jgi:cell division protein FtsL
MKASEKLLYIFLGEIIALLIVAICISVMNYNRYDLNKDGKVDILDLIKLRNYILEEQ